MDTPTTMMGDPLRPSFAPGDTIERDGRCGRVVQTLQIGVMVEWWDDSRAWYEMGELANRTTGQPARPVIEPSESHSDQTTGALRLQETL